MARFLPAHYGEPLAPREIQILTAVAEGHTNAAIGHRLGIKTDTVKTYMRRIFIKLGARDRAHAVVLAHGLGRVDLSKVGPSRIPAAEHAPRTEPAADQAQTDRCRRCRCGDCGGLLEQHSGPLCSCPDCHAIPRYACTRFVPDQRIGFIAEQLGPLLSTHLGERQQRRCLAVAHAAHHALIDYDTPRES